MFQSKLAAICKFAPSYFAMRLVSKYMYVITGIAGAAAGWGYWYFVGCVTGTCAITSKPVNSMLYGALMGLLLLSSLRKKNKPRSKSQ